MTAHEDRDQSPEQPFPRLFFEEHA